MYRDLPAHDFPCLASATFFSWIGSLPPLRLARMITVVLVMRHSIEHRSILNVLLNILTICIKEVLRCEPRYIQCLQGLHKHVASNSMQPTCSAPHIHLRTVVMLFRVEQSEFMEFSEVSVVLNKDEKSIETKWSR